MPIGSPGSSEANRIGYKLRRAGSAFTQVGPKALLGIGAVGTISHSGFSYSDGDWGNTIVASHTTSGDTWTFTLSEGEGVEASDVTNPGLNNLASILNSALTDSQFESMFNEREALVRANNPGTAWSGTGGSLISSSNRLVVGSKDIVGTTEWMNRTMDLIFVLEWDEGALEQRYLHLLRVWQVA